MEVTEILQRLHGGEADAMHELIPLVYDELKKLSRAQLRREVVFTPMQTTALVHEAFLKLAGSRHPQYENRAHFYGIASRLMRQVLVDTARARGAAKRDFAREMQFTDAFDRAPHPNRSLLAMEDALQALEKTDELKARLIEMRYFGGMSAEECADALAIPAAKIRRELRLARAWLHRELDFPEAS
jgi:RNA polymerase sigma factor (TIGR02999 family)